MKNPTLLSLLEMGCTIEFPSGYKMKGDTTDGYIQLSHEFSSDGVRILDRDGVNSAMRDKIFYEKECKKLEKQYA